MQTLSELLSPAGIPSWSSLESACRVLRQSRERRYSSELYAIPQPHERQAAFLDSPAKRIVIRAGRRGGKTVGVAIASLRAFLGGGRILYAAPTQDQVDRFWTVVTQALASGIDARIFHKNETRHMIELAGSEQRIRAKTAWNADMLRGDYADLLILDEFQLMNEDTWNLVGAPMLLDNNGDAVFVYTPPSLHSRSVSKANDPQHAGKLFKFAEADTTGRWETFHWSSRHNPHIDEQALQDITLDMTSLAYRMEILAEDVDEAPGAMWARETIELHRVLRLPESIDRVVVAVDPSATRGGDEAGIVKAAKGGAELLVISDDSIQGAPLTWAREAVAAFYRQPIADCIVAEANNGGEMVELTIHTVDPKVPVKLVHASRGKATRAEPVSAIYEQGRAHHVGSFPALEDEMCLWIPGAQSPNRMDALVWAATELMLEDYCASPDIVVSETARPASSQARGAF